jgi:hypothetical protein
MERIAVVRELERLGETPPENAQRRVDEIIKQCT